MSIEDIIERHAWRFQLGFLNATTEAETAGEFLFCLLGGYGITYEANKAAFEWLKANNCNDIGCVLNFGSSEQIASLLKCIPKNGDPTNTFSYRFYNQKAATLSLAARWLDQTHGGDLSWCYALAPTESRRMLLGCPGMGYKTASWFLRNIGNGHGLAILDVHVTRVGKRLGILSVNLDVTKHYELLERELTDFGAERGIAAGDFDLLLWSLSRGSLEDRDGQLRIF